MTVLVAYDGSDQSEFALEMAFGSFPDEPICLAHVIKPFADYTEAGGYSVTRYEQEFERAESMLQEVIDGLPEGRDITMEVRYGRPVHELLSVATDRDVDRIVVGSHGRDGAKRLLLGSVAETVVRRAPVPVTVVRQPPQIDGDGPTRIIVPFDDSDSSKAALSHAVEQYPEAAITALYAVYPPEEVTEPGDADAIADWAESLDDHTADVIHGAEELAGRPIETDTVEGNPSSAIVSYAESEGADHIVMGSHGRDGLSRLIMGSIAETVVRRAPTSVTVVREPTE